MGCASALELNVSWEVNPWPAVADTKAGIDCIAMPGTGVTEIGGGPLLGDGAGLGEGGVGGLVTV